MLRGLTASPHPMKGEADMSDQEKIELLEKQIELLEKIVELQKSAASVVVPYYPAPVYPQYPYIGDPYPNEPWYGPSTIWDDGLSGHTVSQHDGFCQTSNVAFVSPEIEVSFT